MALGLIYKNQKPVFREVGADTPYLEYPLFADTGIVRHGFSTRMGGVSKGCYTSMNLSFTRGDRKEDVRENFRRMAAAVGVDCKDMVFSQQTHTTNVRKVTEEDRGAGILRPLAWKGIDGLVTNVPGVCLVTFYADCVPLFFVDPVRKAIGLSHSGWRGTVGKIGKVTAERMKREYGSEPEDLLAAIGPSICGDCYEVGEDVIEKFRENFAEQDWPRIFRQKGNGKYLLDLWEANAVVFSEAGILPEHVAVSNLCTCCNSTLLFSHRASGERRGNLAAFLALQ